MASKDFSAVVELYLHANDLAYRESLLNVGALRDIRAYLRAQSSNLVEIIIDELHNHLYLKSPYCDGRWSAYKYMQNELPRLDEIDVVAAAAAGEGGVDEGGAFGDLGNKKNPEADTKAYIGTLVRALHALGKLPFAAENITQRLATEVGSSVDRTAAEVRARHPYIVVGQDTTLFDSDGDIDEQIAEPLRDFLWTLFSKWDAMLAAFMSLESSIAGLMAAGQGSNGRVKTASTQYVGIGRAAVWSAFEAELRRVVADYLAQSDASSASKLAGGRRRKDELFLRKDNHRQSHRTLFDLKVSLTGGESRDDTDADELNRMIGDSVPGLLSESVANSGVRRGDKMVADARAERLLLAHPSPLNVIVVLPPVIALLWRISENLDDGNHIGDYTTKFLNEVFYKQLAGAMDQFLAFAINDVPSAWSTAHGAGSDVRICSNLENALKLLQKTATMVEMMPMSSEAHEASIIRILSSTLGHCRRQYETITQRSTTREEEKKLSAAWALRPQIRAIWHGQLRSDQVDGALLVSSVMQEVDALRELRTGLTITADLLLKSSAYATLVNLYVSVREFTAQLRGFLPNDAPAEAGRAQRRSDPWFLPTRKGAFVFRSTLSEPLLDRYHGMMDEYIELCCDMLVCMRTELRTHLMSLLHQSMSSGNFSIEERAGEIDPSMTELNHDVVRMHGAAHRQLSGEEEYFITLGMAAVIDDVLVNDCERIPAMTPHGAEKMSLSILALQQNLRNVLRRPAAVQLNRSRSFYELFPLGPEELLSQIAANQVTGFERDVYAHLIKLHVERLSRGADKKVVEKMLREKLAALDAALRS